MTSRNNTEAEIKPLSVKKSPDLRARRAETPNIQWELHTFPDCEDGPWIRSGYSCPTTQVRIEAAQVVLTGEMHELRPDLAAQVRAVLLDAASYPDLDAYKRCAGCGHDFHPDSSPELDRCWQCAEITGTDPETITGGGHC
jgi:hypothetical protein